MTKPATLRANTPWDRYAEWWDVALSTGEAPPEIVQLAEGGTCADVAEVKVSPERAADLVAWAEALPGWTIDTPHRSLRHPFRVHGAGRGFRSRPTGRDRIVGVPLTDEEHARLAAVAKRRGVTVAALLREGGLALATRP